MDDRGLGGQAFEFRSADRRQLLWLMSAQSTFAVELSTKTDLVDVPNNPCGRLFRAGTTPGALSRPTAEALPAQGAEVPCFAGVFASTGGYCGNACLSLLRRSKNLVLI